MNETLGTIRNRRSVRNFTDKPVPRELVEQIVEAGTGRSRLAYGLAPEEV